MVSAPWLGMTLIMVDRICIVSCTEMRSSCRLCLSVITYEFCQCLSTLHLSRYIQSTGRSLFYLKWVSDVNESLTLEMRNTPFCNKIFNLLFLFKITINSDFTDADRYVWKGSLKGRLWGAVCAIVEEISSHLSSFWRLILRDCDCSLLQLLSVIEIAFSRKWCLCKRCRKWLVQQELPRSCGSSEQNSCPEISAFLWQLSCKQQLWAFSEFSGFLVYSCSVLKESKIR